MKQSVVDPVPASNASQVTIQEFDDPVHPADGSVTVAKDGAVWWGTGKNGYGMVRMQGNNVSFVPLPSGQNPYGSLFSTSMDATPNGRVWYDASASAQQDDFDYATAGASQASVGGYISVNPSVGYLFGTLKTAPDGNMWFVAYSPPLEYINGCIGTCAPAEVGYVNQNAAGGAATTYLVPQPADYQFTVLSALTVGPDGLMWAGGSNLTNVPGGTGFYRYTTSGQLVGVVGAPNTGDISDAVTGPDHNVWFVDPQYNQIVRLTPAGVTTTFKLPTPLQGMGAFFGSITVGGDGALWFTDGNANKIGRITTSGQLSEYALPSGNDPEQIAGPLSSPGCGNDELWVSLGSGQIDRVIIHR